MRTLANLTMEERIGLGIAAAAHLALVYALVTHDQPVPAPLPEPQEITVSLAEEVSLTSTAPDPAAAPQAAIAPVLSPEPEPEPLPEPAPPVAVQQPPPPRPVERARAEPRPTPAPRATARPTPAPSPSPRATARPTPAPAPTRRARPEPEPTRRVERSGGSRLGSDFLAGTSAGERSESQGTPAATFGPAEQASLSQAINRQLKPHWSAPQGVDAELLVTVLSWELNTDGSLRGRPRVVSQSGINDSNRPQAELHAERAIRAVHNLAAPFNLPEQFYDRWRRVSRGDSTGDCKSMIKSFLTVALLLAAVPAAAQQSAPAPAVSAPTTPAPPPAAEADMGLSGSVTDESEWQDLGIAIPAFATNRDQPTPANAQGTAALGMELSRVIFSDLRNNGLFRPVGPALLPRPTYEQISAPAWGTWRGRSAEMLVHGYVQAAADGQLTVGCYLYDVQLQQQLVREGWVVAPTDWRRAAHKCADMVYSRLSGEDPFFDSKIAYIAETGPKDNRVKRLAIMDSDGANHRFITNGQSMALTPRYSPDYSKIVYLSYLNGNPRIFVYDIGSGRQTLVTESQNPVFAPRWSPDGRSIMYSMAIAGNTDIYRVSATGGGTPAKLTDSPGLDVGGSYSPDGRRIVFESDRSGSQQCYVMDADGSNQRRISFFGGRCATPEWSPRGDQIAFTHIAGDLRVAVMSPSGGGLRHLTDSWQDEAPTWAPNGRIVQFFRTQRGSGEAALWQVDLTGRNERRLDTPVGASDPAWGPVLP